MPLNPAPASIEYSLRQSVEFMSTPSPGQSPEELMGAADFLLSDQMCRLVNTVHLHVPPRVRSEGRKPAATLLLNIKIVAVPYLKYN